MKTINDQMTSLYEKLEELYQRGFFDPAKTLEEVQVKLKTDGYNFSDSTVRYELDSSNHLYKNDRYSRNMTSRILSVTQWVQKVPPSSELHTDQFIYDKNSQHSIYTQIKNIIRTAKADLFIVDRYFDNKDAFQAYTESFPKNVRVRILAIKLPENEWLSDRFKKEWQDKKLELRRSSVSEMHDRVLFIDSDAWVIGQSLKDAGNQPAYLIKVKDADKLRSIYEDLWANSSTKIF